MKSTVMGEPILPTVRYTTWDDEVQKLREAWEWGRERNAVLTAHTALPAPWVPRAGAAYI